MLRLARQRQLDQQLGFRPRYQHCRRDPEAMIVELAFAHDIGNRFARRPPRRQGTKLSFLTRIGRVPRVSDEIGIVHSQHRYASAMRSTTPRFPSEPGRVATPVAVYNAHIPNTKAEVPYAAAFSSTQRWAPEPERLTLNLMYNTQNHLTISRKVRDSAVSYVALRSKVPRMGIQPRAQTAPLLKDADGKVILGPLGPHPSLAEEAERSGMRYSTMTTKSKTTRGFGVRVGDPALGPGTYSELPTVWDRRKTTNLQRPLSSLASTSRRFSRR